MADLSFVCGQVRALESKLLDVNRLDRMIGAETPEDAFRVLVELQYSEYFDDETSIKDFTKIIEQGLFETKQLLINGSQNYGGLQFLWLRFDLNNIKRALKRKLIEGGKDLGEFSEESGYSKLGNLSETDLQEAVFEEKASDNLPDEFKEGIALAEDIFQKKNEEFRFVEFALDKAYFSICRRNAEQIGSNFLRDILSFWIDSANFRTLARCTLALHEKLPAEAWIEGGRFFFADTEKVESFDDLQKFSFQADFSETITAINEPDQKEEILAKIEQAVDRRYHTFLHEAVLGGGVGIAIPFSYFEQRLQNARMIKFVIFAKFHGLEPGVIYEALKEF